MSDDALRLSERETNRQALQPADEHRFDARRLAREFKPLEARQQFLHQNPHLHPREMLAEADVRAEARSASASCQRKGRAHRSEEHTSELQSLMRISYAVFC